MSEESIKDIKDIKGNEELNLDDLESVAGGNDPRGRIVWCVDCGASYYAAEGHDCPDQ